jgi:hypothetical protein
VEGGAKSVNQLLGPTIHALQQALEKYNQALREDMAKESVAMAV